MKKVITYSRISTNDQSNWSISFQEGHHQSFCQKKTWHIIRNFVDEGQSAKNFDRANWKALEEFVQANYKDIDYLLVIKFDRFSRNLREALNMIHTLETKYNIFIVSEMEDIGLDPASPHYYKWRIDMLCDAEYERIKIVSRTKSGILGGKQLGRFLNKAPFGYINARDEKDLPIINLIPEQARIVRFIFDSFIAGISYAEINRLVKAKFDISFYKERMHRILTNPVYGGLIHIKADKDTPEQYVPGLHAAIIDESLWWQVQALTKRENRTRALYNPEAYLKSVICCQDCYRPLTSSNPKGKRKHYWYYECTTHRKNFRADAAHEKMVQIFSNLSFTAAQLGYIRTAVADKLKTFHSDTTKNVLSLERKLADVKQKISSLDRKYIELETVDAETYLSFKESFNTEKLRILEEIRCKKQLLQSEFAIEETEFAKMSKLETLFQSLDIHGKHLMIQKVFGKSLTYDGNTYRTPYLHRLFISKSLLLKGLGLLNYEKKAGFFSADPLGEDNDASTEHPIFDFLNFLKTAS